MVRQITPAGEIVAEMMGDAHRILTRLAGALPAGQA